MGTPRARLSAPRVSTVIPLAWRRLIRWFAIAMGIGIFIGPWSNPAHPAEEAVAVTSVGPTVGPTVGTPDPLPGLHARELEVIKRFQGRGDLGWVMRLVTELGPGKFMGLLIVLLLYAVDARLAWQVVLAVLLSLWLRELLALVLQSPRPYWIDPAIQTFRDPPIRHPTHGLPSGHATAAAAFWLLLAAEVRRGWAWSVAGLITLAVCVSRVYLGLHFISDVVVGAALGSLVVVAGRCLGPWMGTKWDRWPPRHRLALAFGMGWVLAAAPTVIRGWVFTEPPPAAWGTMGESARGSGSFPWTAGVVMGLLLARMQPLRWTGVGDPWRWRWGRLALVAVPVLAYLWRPSWLKVSSLLAHQPVMILDAARFALAAIAGWAAWRAMPWVFTRVGLGREPQPVPGPGPGP